MNKDIIKKTLKQSLTMLSNDDYVVIMGAAMVLLGYKDETDDIDIFCNESAYESLMKYHSSSYSKSGKEKIVIGCISIYKNWDLEDTVVVDGIKVSSVNSIVANKLCLCRKKDLNDLLLISQRDLIQDNRTVYYSVFSYPYTLRGVLSLGEKPTPIIIVNGFFSTNKIGPNRLYYSISELLNDLGFTVLRIDLSGMGDSDGRLEDITYNRHLFDLLSVIENITNYLQCNEVHLLGHCEGCSCIFDVLKYTEKISSISCISPFFPDVESLNKLLGEELCSQLKTQPFIWRKGVYCDKSFMDAAYSIMDTNNIKLARKIDSLFLIPEKDEFSNVDSMCDFLSRNGFSYRIIDNSNHNFSLPIMRKHLFHALTDRFIQLGIEK